MEQQISPFYIFSKAWNKIWENPLRHFGGLFLIILLYGLLSLLFTSLTIGNVGENFKAVWEAQSTGNFNEIFMETYSARSGGVLLNLLISFVLNILFAILLLGFALDVVRDEYEGIVSLFKKYVNGKNFLGILMISLIFYFVIIVPFILLMGISLAVAGPRLGFILVVVLILALLYVLIRLSLAPFYVIDKDMDFMSALTASWNVTGPHVWSMLGYISLIILSAIAIFFLLGLLVGVFYGGGGGTGAVIAMVIFFILYFISVLFLELLELLGFAYYYEDLNNAGEVVEI